MPQHAKLTGNARVDWLQITTKIEFSASIRFWSFLHRFKYLEMCPPPCFSTVLRLMLALSRDRLLSVKAGGWGLLSMTLQCCDGCLQTQSHELHSSGEMNLLSAKLIYNKNNAPSRLLEAPWVWFSCRHKPVQRILKESRWKMKKPFRAPDSSPKQILICKTWAVAQGSWEVCLKSAEYCVDNKKYLNFPDRSTDGKGSPENKRNPTNRLKNQPIS